MVYKKMLRHLTLCDTSNPNVVESSTSGDGDNAVALMFIPGTTSDIYIYIIDSVHISRYSTETKVCI